MKITPTDHFGLLAVWQVDNQGWELVSITRLKPAIALCNCDETERLVFPTCVDPNQVSGKRLKASVFPNEDVKPVNKRELLLELIENLPGQIVNSLAEGIGTSRAAAKGYLRTLVRQGKVHCRRSPADGRSKLYYSGQKSAHAESEVNIDVNKVVRPIARRELPLKDILLTLEP